MYKKYIFISLIIFSFSACIFPNQEQKNYAKEWAYVEVQTIYRKDTTNSYVYGQINKNIIERIKSNSKAKGLFAVENARYVNDDDLLQVYEDKDDSGVLVYRIEHIQSIELFKKDPILFFDKKRLHESSIKYFKRNY